MNNRELPARLLARTLDTLSGGYDPVFGPRNDDRLPPVLSLDARVDRTFQLGGAMLTVFVDAIQATNHLNAEEVV